MVIYRAPSLSGRSLAGAFRLALAGAGRFALPLGFGLRFGFRFVNNTTTFASDPAFGIDEFKVISVAVDDIEGCTEVNAYNYAPEATVDSGCCFYLDVETLCGPGTHWEADLGYCVITCQADFNYDGTIGTPDLLDFLGVFGTDCP